jgi:hypothetical protein
MDMKNILRALMIFLVLPAVVACNDVEELSRTPGEVAVLFFNSITACDVEGVRDNVIFDNEDEARIFDGFLEKFFVPDAAKPNPRGNDAGYTVILEKVDNDTAYVELQAMSAVDKQVKMTVRMLKDDGDWKVDGSQAVLHRVE